MKKNETITITQAQLDALVKKAVADALASSQETSTKSAGKKKTTKKSTKSDKPDTRAEALALKYGNKEARKAYVRLQSINAQSELKAKKVKFTVNAYGKVQFAPFKEQTQFEHKSDFSKFRENFRKQYPYA